MNLSEIVINWIKEHPYRTGFYVLMLVVLTFVWIKYGSRIKSFIGEVKVELGKCIWPVDPKETGWKRYRELIGSTVVVVVGGLLLSVFILAIDTSLSVVIKNLIKIG